MESLYVCHFSNGHIKVGRSIEPGARIATHADRVSCMGIELSEHFIVECTGPAAGREAALIARCVDAATTRYQNEWFAGLDYADACRWAVDCAQHIIPDPTTSKDNFGYRLTQARHAKGMTQTELGRGMRMDGGDLGKAAIWHWECNNGSPSVTQLKWLCERLDVSADALIGYAAQSA